MGDSFVAQFPRPLRYSDVIGINIAVKVFRDLSDADIPFFPI